MDIFYHRRLLLEYYFWAILNLDIFWIQLSQEKLRSDLKKYNKCGKGDISGSIPKIQSAQTEQLVTHKHLRQQQQPQQLQLHHSREGFPSDPTQMQISGASGANAQTYYDFFVV